MLWRWNISSPNFAARHNKYMIGWIIQNQIIHYVYYAALRTIFWPSEDYKSQERRCFHLGPIRLHRRVFTHTHTHTDGDGACCRRNVVRGRKTCGSSHSVWHYQKWGFHHINDATFPKGGVSRNGAQRSAGALIYTVHQVCLVWLVWETYCKSQAGAHLASSAELWNNEPDPGARSPHTSDCR